MRRVAFDQVIFASLLGVISGVYIFNPKYFVEYQKQNERKTVTKEAEKK